ncbi:MAG: DUF3566 domain-containing protein [Brachybacterium sp.]|nr:DUF3566 domain-containing protein [Brachybacterium sp.]
MASDNGSRPAGSTNDTASDVTGPEEDTSRLDTVDAGARDTRGGDVDEAPAGAGTRKTGRIGTFTAEGETEEHGAARGARGTSRTERPDREADARPARTGPRRIRLTLARLDPFSVMKLSFLLAIGIGIATVVAVALLWNIVDAMGLWSMIDSMGRDLNNQEPLPFMEFLSFTNFVSYGTVIAVVNVFLITALGTLFAFLYNIVAALLGGLRMTFTDE